MTKRLVLFLLLLCGGAAEGNQFVLRNLATGAEQGPFTYTNRTVLIVDGQAYELRQINTDADRLSERMKSIIIPRIEFRQANIRDVVAFLRDASEAADEKRESVNIALSMIPTPLKVSTNPPTADLWMADSWGAAPAPNPVGTITLNLRRVSLYDAISIICEMTGLEYRIDERGIVFLDQNLHPIRDEN